MALPPIGAQLLVFSKQFDMKTQMEDVLDSVKDSGYAGVEAGGSDAAQLKAQLDARGLTHGGMHFTPSRLRDVQPVIEFGKTTGCHHVSNSGLLVWNERSRADYLETVAILNDAGRKLKDAGMQLHYHHHDFEFEKVDGDVTGMDLLHENLDPDCVDFNFDVAWIQKGGQNPAAYLRKYKDRTTYLHFKDFDSNGEWTELGRGVVNFGEILAVLPELTGVEWVMLEQDTTKIDARESARISRAYLRDTFGY